MLILQSFFVKFKLEYSGYGYPRVWIYTRTRPVNMRVLKILAPCTCKYPFRIFISYPLLVLSMDAHSYEFFWHPYFRPSQNNVFINHR